MKKLPTHGRPRKRPKPRKQDSSKVKTSRGVCKIAILDLPAELRVMIVRNLIHSEDGPEVYVGRPRDGYFTMRYQFYSPVTDTMEYGPLWQRNDIDQLSWVWAYRTLRPLMACKTLYYEATAVFFREKHFVLGSSTYAHAWLRRIGQRNQVNLRQIHLQIHKEFTITGGVNRSGSLWIEVLRKLGRSARDLKVLGFQFDGEVSLWECTLMEAFLRMKTFQNLKQIDLVHSMLPGKTEREEFVAMMAFSTRTLVRCLHHPETSKLTPRLMLRALHDDDGLVRLFEGPQLVT